MDVRMRNLFRSILAIGMLTGCAFGAVSCSDDDDIDDPGKEQPGKRVTLEMVAQKAAVKSVLQNLAGVEPQDSMGIDFEGKQYEPVIGKVRDESQTTERSVLADDEVEASLKFRALVSNEDFVKETTDGYVIDLTDLNYRLDGRKQKLGKLTYHRSTDGTCLGYADVDIACVPQLQRITYLTKEQWGSNGWDEDGRWQSPCLFGQVWENAREGLKYVCVVESRSDTDGWLINVQAGRSGMYEVVAGNEGNKGAWRPWHPVSQIAIENYVKLCIDAQYYDMKQALRKKYPNEIFPPVPVRHGTGQECEWSNYGYLHTTDGDDGFGTSKKGYGHWVGDLGNDGDYYTPGAGPEVIIVRDGWLGDYAWVPARDWRHQEHYCMAPRARYDSSRYWFTRSYVYTTFENSDYCDGMASKYPYTANGYSFRGTPPAGFGLEAIYDPATEGF